MGTAAAKDTEDANNVYLKTTAEGQRPCPAADPEEFFTYVPDIFMFKLCVCVFESWSTFTATVFPVKLQLYGLKNFT